MPDMRGSYVLIGAGRCGLGMAGAMLEAALPLVGIVSRSPSSRRRARRLFPGVPVSRMRTPLPAASCYVLAVADDALAEVAAALAPMMAAKTIRAAIHTSGLHPSSVLEPIRQRGVAVGSCHPLVAFPPPNRRPPVLRGAVAAIEGEPAGQRAAHRLARQLEMQPRRLAAADKALYHAAAAVAGNLTHVLIVLAKEMLVRTGFSPSEAGSALTPLVSGSCEAALAARGFERLSGALARGDTRTLAAHLAALPSDISAAYRAVAEAALPRLAAVPSGRRTATGVLAGTLTPPSSCASVTLMPYGEGD